MRGAAVIARATYPAQIVFVESDRGHRWVGRLLRPDLAVDAQTGHPVAHAAPRPLFLVVEDPETGRCVATMQGGARGGRRYRSFPSVTEAQIAGIRWAARRFRVSAEWLNQPAPSIVRQVP
jgi:hypothetical protein